MIKKDFDLTVDAMAQRALLEPLLKHLTANDPTLLYKMLRDLDQQMNISPGEDEHHGQRLALKEAQVFVLRTLEKHDPQK